MQKRNLLSGIGKSILGLAALAVGLLASVPAAAHADTMGFVPNEMPDSNPAATGLAGFEFTLNHNIAVTQLGFYVQSIGGGDAPHVSLINVTGGQTSVPTVIYDTGDLNSLVLYPAGLTNGTMNYFSVGTPILLTTGQTYEVTAPIYFSQQYNSTAGFTLGGAIASSSYLLDPGFAGWDNSGYNFTSLAPTSPGPNVSADFQYNPVPEPASLGLLGVGAVGLLARRRRA